MMAWRVYLILCLSALPVTSGSIFDFLFAEPEETGRPAFCKSHQCPNFTVIQTETDYQVRRYESTSWAVTEKQNELVPDLRMFTRLSKYTLQGDNNLGLKMVRTVPVLIEVREPEPERMYFMIPEDRQSDPPIPTGSLISITRMPVMTVYAREFSGYLSDDDWKREVRTLKRALRSHLLRFNRHMMFKASYDNPFALFNCHNEVWLIAI